MALNYRLSLRLACAAALLTFTATIAFAGGGDWKQWGGADRNFIVESPPLAQSWPEDGPRALWRRDLGDGYSAIAAEDGRLYTMYYKDGQEFFAALDAQTGETVWEKGQPAELTEQMNIYGPGVNAAPLVLGEHVFMIGMYLDLICFEKATGAEVWRRDLLEENKLTVPTYGHACSPLAYGDWLIMSVSGDGSPTQTLTAFDRATGRTIWTSENLHKGDGDVCTYSSPIVINFAGEDQLVYLTNERIYGLNPRDGQVLWSHVHVNKGVNVSTPVWCEGDLLFMSGAYDSGSRVIRLKREQDRTTTEELWYSRKLRIHHGNPIVIDGFVYGTSGDFGPAFFGAFDLLTGKAAWRKRGFSKATFVYADEKLIMLDEDGTLSLLSVTPEDAKVLSQCKIAERIAWTSPTLADGVLYIRDRKQIMALDLRAADADVGR